MKHLPRVAFFIFISISAFSQQGLPVVVGSAGLPVRIINRSEISEQNFTTTYKSRVDSTKTALTGKVDKITGKGLSQNDLSNALLAQISATTLPYNQTVGKNLIDASKQILGYYYSNTTGAITARANSKRLPFIAVQPNTTYTISGYSTQFFGVEFNVSGARVQSIGSVTGVKTSMTFTTSSTTVFVGLNVYDASPSDFIFAQMELGSSITSYAQFQRKQPDDLLDALQRLSIIIPGTRKNLLNPLKVIDGFNYNETTGAWTSGPTASKKALPLIPVKPNTTYSIQGYTSTHFGNEYGANGINSFIRSFDPGGISKTKLQFTTSSTTYFLGLNSNTFTASFTGGQLEEGGYTDIEAYAAIPTGASNALNSNCYYDFTSTSKVFHVYIKYDNSTDLYAGFQIENEIDVTEIGYQDYYRINLAKQYKLVSGVMVDQGVTLLTNGESEFVFQQSGKGDFTGGFHGDEKKTYVAFYANGQPVLDVTTIGLTACNDFWYLEKSTMHETATTAAPTVPITGHPVLASHIKRTSFSQSGYETTNEVTWQVATNIALIYFGIVCITPMTQAYTDEKSIVVNMVQDDGFPKIDEAGSHTLNYYNATTKLGARITTTILNFTQNNTDNVIAVNKTGKQQTKDTSLYSKYYWNLDTKTTTIGDVWKGHCRVRFLYGI